MEKPLVSVLVTFYNQERFVDETLTSVFEQKTKFPFEVILGDDGSSDGTMDKLKAWKDRYPEQITINVMPRDKNKKYEPIVRVSDNRVTMLSLAKGQYVTYLDGDDLYTDMEKLQRQVEALEKHPECVACGHYMSVFQDGTDEKTDFTHISDKELIFDADTYWRYVYLHSDSLMFRNVYERNVADIQRDIFDDNIIMYYFLRFGKVIYIPYNMASYRQLPKSSWNKRSEVEKYIINLADYMDEIRINPEMAKASFMRHFFEMWGLYKNRKTSIYVDETYKRVLNNRFIKDTVNYSSKSFAGKMIYEIRSVYLIAYRIYVGLKKKRFSTGVCK